MATEVIRTGSPSGDASNDFIVLSRPQSAQNGGSPVDLSQLQLSLQSFCQDISLEEARNMVQELMKENQELKGTIRENNNIIKGQFEILNTWKTQISLEREDLKKKYDQAKTVVQTLKAQKEESDKKVTELTAKPGENLRKQLEEAQRNVKELEAQKEEALGISQATQSELTEELEALRQELAKQQKEGILIVQDDDADLQAQVEKLQGIVEKAEKEATESKEKARSYADENKRIQEELDALKKVKEEVDVETVKLKEANSKLAGELEETANTLKRVREINERVSIEKMDLLALNNQLNSQLHMYKSPSSNDLSVNESSSVVIFDRETVAATPSVDYKHVAPGTPSALPVELDSHQGAAAAMPEMHKPVSGQGVNKEKVQAKQEKSISDLLVQLQEERCKSNELMNQIASQTPVIDGLKRQLQDKEQLLASSAAKVTTSQRKAEELRIQLEAVTAELTQIRTQQKQSSASEQNIQPLRNQVMSLVNELQGTTEELSDAKQTIMKLKERNESLEMKVKICQDDLDTQRSKDDELIETLRFSIGGLESSLAGEKQEKETLRINMMELSKKFQQLFHEHHEHLKYFHDYKAGQEATPATVRKLGEKIDNLTAQLLVAEESAVEKENEIATLRAKLTSQVDTKQTVNALQEKIRTLESQLETVPVLKAQLDVYQSDFNAERKARESMHEEREKLKNENQHLHIQISQLQDELKVYTQKQLDELQRKHSQGTYGYLKQRLGFVMPKHSVMNAPVQSQSGAHYGTAPRTGHGAVGPGPFGHQIPGGYPRPTPEEYCYNQGRYTYPVGGVNLTDDRAGLAESQPPQEVLGQADQGQSQGHQGQSQGHRDQGQETRHGQETMEVTEETFKCPKCDVECPDLDSLQIHVEECVD